jgi:hypothetical protein
MVLFWLLDLESCGSIGRFDSQDQASYMSRKGKSKHKVAPRGRVLTTRVPDNEFHCPMQSPSTTKRFVKHLEHFFLEENKPSESDRQGIFLHADKKSKEDEDFFRQAMADPDKYLEADCVAFSPKLGPGVSKERAYAEETVAFALNSLHGPTVETLLQQHARFRTVTDSTIYYKQIISPVVDLPKTTEHVFLAIERDDKQLAKMLGDVASLDFLEGSRAVCDRSSASCVLYANNILAKVESYLQYIPKLQADLERQGFQVSIEYIDPQVRA